MGTEIVLLLKNILILKKNMPVVLSAQMKLVSLSKGPVPWP